MADHHQTSPSVASSTLQPNHATTRGESTPGEYVLGTGGDELARLAFQHRLWSDAAHEAWRSASVGPGQRVLDIGSGPGFASFDLAELVRAGGLISGGEVVAIDESAGFIHHLNAQAHARGLNHLRGLVGDVQALTSISQLCGGSPFDLAYARWVLCFVPRPDRVVLEAAKLLRPGGCFIVHDYFNYSSMRIAPMGTAFSDLYTRVVRATDASWRARGGDPDVVGRLPAMCQQAGLSVISIRPIQRIARPGETMFHWVATWWRNYVPKLVAMGSITPDEQAAFFKGWDELEHSPSSFVMCPCVYELIAQKS